MRALAALALAALLWVAYAASPFVSLWRLARAVQAHDVAEVAAHVNVRALRASLTRQTLAAVTAATAASGELVARDRQLAADAAAALVEPVVAALVTPETILDILDDGWPQGLALPARPPAQRPGGDGLRLGSLRELRDLYVASDMHGFRTLLVAFPPDEPRAGRFRLRLRLRGLGWRLVDVELPDALRDAISRKLAAEGAGER